MHLDTLDETKLRLRHGQKWALYPADVLPAWVADMDFAAPPGVTRVRDRPTRASR